MSDPASFDSSEQEDDLELLQAMRDAFGEDAVDASQDCNGDSLQELLRDIDSDSIESAKAADSNRTANQVNENTLKYIVIRLGETSFGIPMDNVYEIQRVPRITRLPGAPTWVKGVSNLRGNVVSVVNLKILMGFEVEEAATPNERLVVTQSLVDDIDSGLVVDRVIGIRSYKQSQIQPPTASINPQIAPYLTGIVDVNELVVLLDIDKLLVSEKFRQFDAA